MGFLTPLGERVFPAPGFHPTRLVSHTQADDHPPFMARGLEKIFFVLPTICDSGRAIPVTRSSVLLAI